MGFINPKLYNIQMVLKDPTPLKIAKPWYFG